MNRPRDCIKACFRRKPPKTPHPSSETYPCLASGDRPLKKCTDKLPNGNISNCFMSHFPGKKQPKIGLWPDVLPQLSRRASCKPQQTSSASGMWALSCSVGTDDAVNTFQGDFAHSLPLCQPPLLGVECPHPLRSLTVAA